MNNFATSDLYESAFIQANTEIAPGFETRDGWIYFIFPKNEVVTHAVEIFNEGGSVVAIKYANAIKRLRAEMLIRKNM